MREAIEHPPSDAFSRRCGLELLMRYPVEIRKAPDIDEEVTKNFLELIETNAAWKAAVRQ